jgi:hypothetical protein
LVFLGMDLRLARREQRLIDGCELRGLLHRERKIRLYDGMACGAGLGWQELAFIRR